MSKDILPNKHALSEESDTPLYFQLSNLLRQQIHSGILKPGDLIPSESQLCSQYGVSRTTVRQALNQLVEENLIIRRRGKGSFVASQKLHRNLNHLYSFSEDMHSAGLNPYSKVLESFMTKAPEKVLNALGLRHDGSSDVFKLSRLRMAKNEPQLLETTYIPLYLCPGIERENFSTTSLYNTLRSTYGLNLYKALESYESIKLSKEACTLLNCKSSSWGFSIQRIAYLDTGVAYEYTSSVARSDKCIFEVELYANKNKVNFTRKITP